MKDRHRVVIRSAPSLSTFQMLVAICERSPLLARQIAITTITSRAMEMTRPMPRLGTVVPLLLVLLLGVS
jgi:hypothetical protein